MTATEKKPYVSTRYIFEKYLEDVITYRTFHRWIAEGEFTTYDIGSRKLMKEDVFLSELEAKKNTKKES